MALTDHVLKVPNCTFEQEILVKFLNGSQTSKLLSDISSKSCPLFFIRNKHYQLPGNRLKLTKYTSDDIQIT